jgi:hypothetical protein
LGAVALGAASTDIGPLLKLLEIVISKLVGEVSLTGFLFVYALNGACW